LQGFGLYYLFNEVFSEAVKQNRKSILGDLMASAHIYTLAKYIDTVLVAGREDYFYKTLDRYI
jgi:hypothetical protein